MGEKAILLADKGVLGEFILDLQRSTPFVRRKRFTLQTILLLNWQNP